MSRKRWAVLSLSLLLSAAALIVGAVVLVDPFEIYHTALFYQPGYASATQMYSNAGVAKHYRYDSVIIGSSVTENCTPSVYDAALGGRFVKLCMNGGTARDHAKMLEMAFATHALRRVVYGVDLFSYSLYYTNQREQTPDYLYDSAPLNDVSYWFNQSVLFSSIPDALSRLGAPDQDAARDAMYFWDPPELPGAEALAAKARLDRPIPEQEDPARLVNFAAQNLEYNLLPFVRAHRETQFDLFFPPYSLLYWADRLLSGEFDACMAQKRLLMDSLLDEPNVAIYDFQTYTPWVRQPELYYDLIHYTSPVNDAMAQAIARGEGRIRTQAQAESSVEALTELVMELVPAASPSL